MRKALSGILMGILAFAFIVLTTGSSNASATVIGDIPNVHIGDVGYNARGADSWWNRNKEFVDVTNTSAVDVPLTGLVVTDSWGHDKGNTGEMDQCNSYKFPTFTLAANSTVRVYVGAGTNTANRLFMNSKGDCGYRGHFLNNLGDTVWITLSGVSEAKKYDFENGYYI